MKQQLGRKRVIGRAQSAAGRAGGTEYGRLLADIKERVRAAQYEALRAVNKELVALYWDIGRIIVERQSSEGSWGKSVVQNLAADLQTEFPGIAGFSTQNLWYMRQFYTEYHAEKKLQPLVGEISWAKHLVIMAKCKAPLEREFYLRMTRKFGWSKNVPIHQIENQSYEMTLLNQTNFDRAVTPELRAQAQLAVKDEYVFDFLELGEAQLNGICNAPCSCVSKTSSAPWAACSLLPEASSGSRWTTRNTSSTYCSFIGGSGASSPWNSKSASSSQNLPARYSSI